MILRDVPIKLCIVIAYDNYDGIGVCFIEQSKSEVEGQVQMHSLCS